MKMRNGLFLGLCCMLLQAWGCGEDAPTRENTFVPLTSIEITPGLSSIAVGTSTSLTAIGNFSGLFIRDITTQVTWEPSAGISVIEDTPARRRVKGDAEGETTLRATLDGVEAEIPFTVTDATVTAVSVTPSSVDVPVGITQQFTAIGTFSDTTTQDLTFDAAWASSDETKATVGNDPGTKGLATGVAVGGPVEITATFGVTGTAAMTVTDPVLQSIAITPDDPGALTLDTLQFTATGTFSDGTTSDLTAQASWSSSRTSIATIGNEAGNKGLATMLAPGPTQIRATFGDFDAETTLTVSGSALSSIQIAPAVPAMATGTTLQMTATGTFTDGTTRDITEIVTWSSTNENIATISNAGGSKGIVSGLAQGSTDIRATRETLQSPLVTLQVENLSLTELAVTLTENAGNLDIAAGTTRQLRATGTFSDGSAQDLTRDATWTTSNGNAATVSNDLPTDGRVTGVAAGSVTITAEFRAPNDLVTRSDSIALTVTDANLQTLQITPVNSGNLRVGQVREFDASGTFSDGTVQEMTFDATWSSSQPGFLRVGNDPRSKGLVQGVGAGTANVQARFGEISDTEAVQVVQ